MTTQTQDSETVTEQLPGEKVHALRGLYLAQGLAGIAARMERPLVLTTFLTDLNGVIARAYEDRHFEVPRETRNDSDWRLSQELMAQADTLIVGGSYLARARAPGSHAQDVVHQFEAGGPFEDLGEWRLRAGYEKRSPDLAVIARHLDFKIPEGVLSRGRRVTVFTTDGAARSAQGDSLRAAGAVVVADGKLGVDGDQMIDAIRDEMGARVIMMASGPRVLELLLQARRLDLLYLTRVEREIPFDDPAGVMTLLPHGKGMEALTGFRLTQQYSQERATAGDGSPISQVFMRYVGEAAS